MSLFAYNSYDPLLGWSVIAVGHRRWARGYQVNRFFLILILDVAMIEGVDMRAVIDLIAQSNMTGTVMVGLVGLVVERRFSLQVVGLIPPEIEAGRALEIEAGRALEIEGMNLAKTTDLNSIIVHT